MTGVHLQHPQSSTVLALEVRPGALDPISSASGFSYSQALALGNLAPADLWRRMAERPIFVSAARFEPFGLAVLEAAACGCALVLADIPPFRELWDGAAEFAAPGDATDLARRIDWLMTHPRQRLALGERGRRRAAHFSVARMAAAMAREYRAALGAAPAAMRERAA